MKFRIDSADYFAREEEKGTISLTMRRTNQILYLNRAGRKLLQTDGQWMDLDAFVDGLEPVDASRERVRGDYEALLYKLDAYGLASLAERERSSGTGCRMALPRDYEALSAFLLRNAGAGLSCAVSLNPAHNNRASVYFRLSRQSEYVFISEREGNIEAAMIVSWPNRGSGYTVLSLDSVVYAQTLSEEECTRVTGLLLECVRATLGEQCGKIRYSYMHPRQDWLLRVLCGFGFTQSAAFSREIERKQDMAFYDRIWE